MKKVYYFFCLVVLVAVSCQKDQQETSTSYYSSTGNVLILKIGNQPEAAYEYLLNTSPLINDSLHFSFDLSYSGPVNDQHYCHFTTIPDTLFSYTLSKLEFHTAAIQPESLEHLSYSLPFDSSDFQFIGNYSGIDLLQLWQQISDLDLVKTYREVAPDSHIAIMKIIDYETSGSINIPVKKTLVVLAK